MHTKALIAASVAALIGLVLVILYMRSFEQEASGGAPVAIFVARRDIALGEQLEPDTMLYTKLIPSAYVENRHVRAADVERIRGIRVVSGLRAGEALLWTDLATMSDTARDLSSLVRMGMRAIAIQADHTSTFGGLLRPGDRVDLLLTLDRPKAGEGMALERVTVPLLQNLLVLAAGQDTGAFQKDGSGGGYYPTMAQNVTLSATIEQAQLIAFAAQRGRITVVLRNPDDLPIVDGLGEITLEDVVTVEKREQVQKTRPRASVAANPPPPAPPVRTAPVRIP